MKTVRTVLTYLLVMAAVLAALNLLNNTVGTDILPSLIGDRDWMPEPGSAGARVFTIVTTVATGVLAVAYGLADARVKRAHRREADNGRAGSSPA